MYATLGVAVATLLVVGGVLAGPSILECSRDDAGFGACLREKVAETGLIGPDTERRERPDVVADQSSEPTVPAAPTGWMEANANEYEAPSGAAVDLTGLPVNLTATELVPSVEPPVDVAVAAVSELAMATPVPATEAVTVNLGAPDAALIAEGGTAATTSEPEQVALVGPEGQVTVAGPDLGAPVAGATVLTEPASLTVEATPDAEADLIAVTPEPMVPADALTALDPAPAEPAPVELTADVAVVSPSDPVVLEFDPEYPNVLVLPAPASGEDSSFRSLQLN